MLKFKFILLALAFFRPIASEGIKCEEVEVQQWSAGKHLRTCLMRKTTSINTTEAKIDEPKNETMENISFQHNLKIKFLPVDVYNVFPNLRLIDARSSSITEISKRNFEKLSNLEELELYNNYIEKIPSDAFEDLTSLRELWLKRNKIKFLNGQAFDGLTKLYLVNLVGNVCIDQTFKGAIASLKSEVDKKCGFNEDTRSGYSKLQATVAKLPDQVIFHYEQQIHNIEQTENPKQNHTIDKKISLEKVKNEEQKHVKIKLWQIVLITSTCVISVALCLTKIFPTVKKLRTSVRNALSTPVDESQNVLILDAPSNNTQNQEDV